MKQNWLCEDCGMSGVVTVPDHADVMSVVHEIRKHHDRLAAEHAPNCIFNTRVVRVKTDDEDIYAWNRRVAEAEKTARFREPSQ